MSRRRLLVAGFVVVLAAGALTGLAIVDDGNPPSIDGTDDYPSRYTLVTSQSYQGFGFGTGEAMIVAPDGERAWTYDPPNTRVFDAEVTDAGTILVSTGTEPPLEQCPDRYQDGGSCVHNRILELAPGDNTVVWKYTWYDQSSSHHIPHDADRLENGGTAIVDMGNQRAFVVNQSGTVTWQWNANESLDAGSAFQREFGGPDQQGPESDWTHVNDIDRLENGNFQLSIRNFDAIVEVDPDTNEVVGVIGEPGTHSVLYRQHNPHRIEHAGTALVADSTNNRVVELDVETGDVLWSYYGGENGTEHLAWPRDADRLPNGNTLITDSRNFRVLEVSPSGEVVWEFSQKNRRGILYEADRLNVSATTDPDRLRAAFEDRPEEPDDVPSARSFPDHTPEEGWFTWVLYEGSSWVGYAFPWMGLAESVVLVVGILAGLCFVADYGLRRLRDAKRFPWGNG